MKYTDTVDRGFNGRRKILLTCRINYTFEIWIQQAALVLMPVTKFKAVSKVHQ